MLEKAQVRPSMAVTLVNYVYVMYLFAYFLLQKIVFKIIFLFPSVSEPLIQRIGKVTHMDETTLNTDDWGKSITSWECLKSDVKMYLLDYRKCVTQDDDAYDADVIQLDGTSAKLMDFARGDRPLVVNFGSCS